MNERIQELEKQSYVDADHGDGVYQQFNRWKFAELLIKDFLSICESERDGYVKLRKSTLEFDEKNIYAEGESASDRIRIMAKRRFGVK